MSSPTTVREALIAQAIGDIAELLDRVEVVAPVLREASRALLQADGQLRDDLTGFERGMTAIVENAKIRAVRHIAERTDEAARQSIGEQRRQMAQAARLAFDAEIGATMRWVRTTLQPLLEKGSRESRLERWLAPIAAAVAGSTVTWALMAHFRLC